MAAWNGLNESRLRKSWARTIATIFLIPIGGAITALLVPVEDLHAQTLPGFAKNSTRPVAKRNTGANPEPFDLSFLPADLNRIVAIRPALILKDPGAKDHSFSVLSALAPHIGSLILHLPRTIESIDQVVLGFGMVHDRAKPKVIAREEPDCMVIRSVEEIDWKRFVQTDLRLLHDPDSSLIELRVKGKVYYKSSLRHSSIVSPGECYLFPDARTMVVGREEAVLLAIGQGRESRPELARGSDWRSVESCPIVLAVANLDGDGGFGVYDLVTSLLLSPTSSMEHAQRMTCGVDNLGTLRLHAIVTLPSTEVARPAALALLRDQATIGLSFFVLRVVSALGMMEMDDNDVFTEPDDPPMVKFEKRLVQEMARMVQVRLDGRTIDLTKQTRISLKDLIPSDF